MLLDTYPTPTWARSPGRRPGQQGNHVARRLRRSQLRRGLWRRWGEREFCHPKPRPL